MIIINTEVMFSSKTDNWATPQEFYNKLNEVFDFNLDPCADKYNHKCNTYYTKEINGLSQKWEENVFCNPPYGRVIKDWVKKASDEFNKNNNLIVLLIPARTDTKYQHEYIFNSARYICFIKGRLKFGEGSNSAPFPSQLVIYTKNELNKEQLEVLNGFGKTIKLF